MTQESSLINFHARFPVIYSFLIETAVPAKKDFLRRKQKQDFHLLTSIIRSIMMHNIIDLKIFHDVIIAR